ncbi:MAG: chemotaxis protein MotA [Myxococcota bacterium]|jgi:chemotaxis protein MotA
MAMFGGGAAVALGAIFLSMLMDGNSVGPLIGPSSFVIVMGGAFGAALMTLQTSQISGIFTALKYALTGSPADKKDIIDVLGPLADVARREGMLALEGKLDEIEDPFIKLGVQQLVDGADAEQVAEVLTIDIDALNERHKFGIDFWKAAGGYAPTFGMVGTVIGLINMLGNLSDPAQLGAGMSTALLTTLYGVLLSNVLFLPISGRLDALNKLELGARDVALDGILSIQAGVSTRLLVERLQTYLSPAERAALGDDSAAEAA